jgi:hypothetical protein
MRSTDRVDQPQGKMNRNRNETTIGSDSQPRSRNKPRWVKSVPVPQVRRISSKTKRKINVQTVKKKLHCEGRILPYPARGAALFAR